MYNDILCKDGAGKVGKGISLFITTVSGPTLEPMNSASTSDMKWLEGETDHIGSHRTKFGRHGDLAVGT